MKLKSIAVLAIITSLAFIFPAEAEAQIFQNLKIRKENTELRSTIDSLKKEVEALRAENIMRDSIANEMLDIYEENEDKGAAGLNPEDYSPEITDSLLSLWYVHRQVNRDIAAEQYDMDSIRFDSNVSDDVMKERLEKINSFITLPYNETVRNFMVLYSEKMPTKMNNILGLCQYYMPIFEEVFSQYNLPEELKYVAIIESALNPTAVSRAGAKGMWQFMTLTAKSYGLEINSYVDERLDPFKSSDAAARYLEDSYRLFGDWNLAISSYNCGPGNINKAIRRSGRRDFWSVYEYLPKETRGYVPAFVGAMYAIKYAKEYGLSPTGVEMPVQVDTFEIRRNLHLGQVSDLCGIPMNVLKNLNPQYIQDIIPGDSKTYVLRLPFNYTSSFIEHEDSVYTHRKEEFFNPQTIANVKESSSASSGGTGTRISYKVKSGDSLGKIASRNNVTVSQLKKWNHLNSDKIRAGQRLYIYKAGAAPSSAGASNTSSNVSQSSAKNPSTVVTYTVKSGDSLYKIGKKYGVSADEIMKYNGISSKISVGQKIKIPAK